MCGIAGIIGDNQTQDQLEVMLRVQKHRGPDDTNIFMIHRANLGHNRLAIVDLSDGGSQPMSYGDISLSFNGEIYNYLELKSELSEYNFKTQSDTEVIIAAYKTWGEDCMHKFIGMFAFLLWDSSENKLFAARDRFGVKPLYYARPKTDTLLFASEIKTLIAAGVNNEPDKSMWATYLSTGMHEHTDRTFIRDVSSLPPGHLLRWQNNNLIIHRWYDIAESSGTDFDSRPDNQIIDEYTSLLIDSLKLRFRSDVPVGINLSGGLDSSILLALSNRLQLNKLSAFTFITGDKNYDELPWVQRMVDQTSCSLTVSELHADHVPDISQSVQYSQDEPYGGIPTLAYAKLFESASNNNVKVLLDGQGLDEQWGGYDYYSNSSSTSHINSQGSLSPPLRPECLNATFRKYVIEPEIPTPFKDRLRNLQYRDIRFTKLPRALRYNDRISMRSSIELREPFLDHRLVELALRQLPHRKISNGIHKYLLRIIAEKFLPDNIALAPKRPVQTPQREWLRGCLRNWATLHIENMLTTVDWFEPRIVRNEWDGFIKGKYDNSYFVWQWVNLSLCTSNNDRY